MTTKKAGPRELDEADRLRIGQAREVLQEYGQYVDVADMSDVAYEQRNCRMKAMDLAVASTTAPVEASVIRHRAAGFYRYIWEGMVE